MSGVAWSNHHDRPMKGSCVLKGKHFLLDRALFLVNNDRTALLLDGTAILRFNPASTTYEIQQFEKIQKYVR